MNPNRIERKRAHDREAQRVSRARTKAYIAHLEKTVADLSSSTADERERQLTLRTSDQEKKIENLQSTLCKIRNLLKQVAEPETVAASDQDSPKSTGTATSNLDIKCNSADGSVRGGEPCAATSPDQFGYERPTGCPLARDTTAWQAPDESTKRPGYAECLGVDLSCTDSDANYFPRLTGVLASLEQLDKSIHFSNAKQDDDLLVRAVLFGWEAVEKKLDIIWQFIRAFDEGLFGVMPPVERLAHMRQMRSQLLHKIQPSNQERRPIARCFTQTALQQSRKHFSCPDYFAWPQVRNHLIANRVTYVAERDCIQFAKNFRFLWPFELRDVFMKHKPSGLYTFSEAFNRSYNDLRSYRINMYDGAHALGFFNQPCLSPLTPASGDESISHQSKEPVPGHLHPPQVLSDNNAYDKSDAHWSAEDLKWLSEVEVGQWFGEAWAFPNENLATGYEDNSSNWVTA